jgi:UDP-N-acetylmuramate--alanine ligase
MATLRPGQRVHFIGIGGIGVSAVARIALEKGLVVSGSDVRRSQLTDAMEAAGARVVIGHAPENIDGADVVAVSTAIPAHNVELIAAKERGVRLLHRSEILAELVADRLTIGVTGTHGKGTTSAMIVRILDHAGRTPGFVIGGLLNDYGINARWGDASGPMVLEVDESDGSHRRIPTDYLVCNYLEADHLNYYDDLDHIIQAMADCVGENGRLRKVFVNGDCAGNVELLARIDKPALRYGLGAANDVRGRIEGSGQMPLRFEVEAPEPLRGTGTLAIPGRYNVTNALGAIAVAAALDVPVATSLEALAAFSGLENRFSIVQAGGLTLVKDYISHPTGILHVLDSARDLTDGRVLGVWKPYRYTLLNYLQDEYATAFRGCDELFVTTMYAAEEDPIPGVDTAFIVEKIRGAGTTVHFVPEQSELVAAIAERAQPGDQVIFFGGDDFFRMADAWAAELAGGGAGEAAP